MVSFVMAVLCLAPGDFASTGDYLIYRGEIVAKRGNPAETRKSFDFAVLVEDDDPENLTVAWVLLESGNGAWPWPQVCGRFSTGNAAGKQNQSLPALLYEHEAGLSPVQIPQPWRTFAKALEVGETWQDGKMSYEVVGRERFQQENCWKIVAKNSYSHQMTLLVSPQTGRVEKFERTVFLGQGQEHTLAMQLADQRSLSPESFTAAAKLMDQLQLLKQELRHQDGAQESNWNEEQLAKLRDAASMLESVKQHVPQEWTRFVTLVQQDAAESTGRSRALAASTQKMSASRLAELKVKTLRGEEQTGRELLGDVTVLHFWEYQDTPLQEPYGQVGYLDFLYRQVQADSKRKDRVRIYGVACEPRLADPETRSAAIISVKKMQSFMRINYPIVVDHGDLIRAFGDPRPAGARLPLFVVLDKEGKVIHHHVGTYEVNRDRGLEELSQAIESALPKVE